MSGSKFPPHPFDTILLPSIHFRFAKTLRANGGKITQGTRWSLLVLVLGVLTGSTQALPEHVQEKLDSVFCDEQVRDGFLGITQCSKDFLKKRGVVLNDSSRRHGHLPSLPGYIIKGGRHGEKSARRNRTNIGRIAGAQKLQEVIEQLGVTHVKVAQKWLYHLPGMPEEVNDDNYVVVVERLNIVGHKENKNFLWNLPNEIAGELRDVLLAARYTSLHSANIYMLRDMQTVAIVDTEEYANTPTLEYCLRQFKKMVDPKTVDALP